MELLVSLQNTNSIIYLCFVISQVTAICMTSIDTKILTANAECLLGCKFIKTTASLDLGFVLPLPDVVLVWLLPTKEIGMSILTLTAHNFTTKTAIHQHLTTQGSLQIKYRASV